MQELSLLEFDIANILKHKKMEIMDVMAIYPENKKDLQKILGKESNCLFSEDAYHLLNLNKISQEDVTTLQEYLDYLNMIGG